MNLQSSSGPNWGGSPLTPASSSQPTIHDTIDTIHYADESLPPSYELTIDQTTPDPPFTVTIPAHLVSRPAFRPPPLNQLTTEDANKLLDSADTCWNQGKWGAARTRYTTAAATFNITGDKRNEAFCLQRLGEVCRITKDLKAARAHIWQAHVLFGKCGEISRQLMCERWLARVASDEGLEDEARLLLHSALDHSRAANLRESEGWCLLRLGELEQMNETLIRQAFVIAQGEKIGLLECRCTYNLLRIHRDGVGALEATVVAGPSQYRTENNNSENSRQVGNSDKEGEIGKERQLLDPKGPGVSCVDRSIQVELELATIGTASIPRSDGLSSIVKCFRSWFEKS
ncbi:unnamed protein product [Rhizoctonia solani]|uniref:Uncharacterized protein n=1 Tax=Rhizoctonia solani TaxID=456999 RepID=A0A8H3G941_9AGAM|nr:unnamed protein product [Rhizoctonia solani]